MTHNWKRNRNYKKTNSGHKHSVTCFELFFDDPAEDERRNFLTTDTCNESR